MINRMAILGLSAATLVTTAATALAAPCGPAVLSKVDGQVLVNRGAGFLNGTAGMPLAVGDHVMLRNGNAEIMFVNGTGSALTGAKSMAITACSADASLLSSPVLAQNAQNSPTSTTLRPIVEPQRALIQTTGPGSIDAGALTALGVGTAGVVGLVIAAGASSGNKNNSSIFQPVSP